MRAESLARAEWKKTKASAQFTFHEMTGPTTLTGSRYPADDIKKKKLKIKNGACWSASLRWLGTEPQALSQNGIAFHLSGMHFLSCDWQWILSATSFQLDSFVYLKSLSYFNDNKCFVNFFFVYWRDNCTFLPPKLLMPLPATNGHLAVAPSNLYRNLLSQAILVIY